MNQPHRSSLAALFALAVISTGCAQDRAAPSVTLPKAVVYSGLRSADLYRQFGYHFAVSPDEAWIAVLREWGTRTPKLRVLHRETQKTWDLAIAHDSGSVLNLWFPACFSRDSSRIVLATVRARLDPKMAKLAPESIQGARDARQTTFLDIPAAYRVPESGTTMRKWFAASNTDSEGSVEYSADGKTRYESRTKGQVKSSFLEIKPGGELLAVDYSRVLGWQSAERKAAAEKLAKEAPEMAKVFASLLALKSGDGTHRLSRLCVSPDGKYLAGLVSTGGGFGGSSIGVIIPLERGDLVAHPYAEKVFGRVAWSADSQAIYFYAQPFGRSGRATVHRLALAKMQWGKATPRRLVSRKDLAAPSDYEIQAQQHQTEKVRHYEHLTAIFAKPQTIVEVHGAHCYTASGHILFLGPTKYFGRKQGELTEKWLAKRYVGKPIVLELSPKKKFLLEYSPGGRTGLFNDDKKYPWKKGPGGSMFGMVPVRLGENGSISKELDHWIRSK